MIAPTAAVVDTTTAATVSSVIGSVPSAVQVIFVERGLCE